MAAARAAVNSDTGASASTLLVVRGPAGIGKTALLTTLRETWTELGMDVITVRCRDAVEPWDLFGARSAINAVREHFGRIGDLRLADAIKRASQLCGPETYRSEQRKAALLIALAGMFAQARRENRMVLLVDDVDAVPSPAMLLAPVCRAGHLVVAACRDDGEAGSTPWVLGQLADNLIDLGPLPDESVHALITRHVGAAIDESVLPALRAALGPLLGNPGSLLSVLDHLRRDDRLAVVQDRLCIRDGAPIALPAEHELIERVHRLCDGGRDLVTMVASSQAFTVDDLPVFAMATGRSLTVYGEAVDELIKAGVLGCDRSGRLECLCPALTAAVLAGTEQDSVRHLHRRFVETAVRGRPGLAVEAAKLADHVVVADRTLPSTRAIADLLVACADRVTANDPVRAAAWHRAALWYRVALWHDGGRDLLPRLLRALIRGGSYELLEKVVREVVGGQLPSVRPSELLESPYRRELALAAALAALHTGRAVPESVRAVLGGDTGPIARAGQWLRGVDPAGIDDFLADFAALSSPCPAGAADSTVADRPNRIALRDEMVEAAAIGDLVTVFELAFPGGYGKPATGPLALHHRLVRAFADDAEWGKSLSCARQLELAGDGQTAVHRGARLVAAEICSASGHFKQLSKWLAEMPADGAAGLQRDWFGATSLFGSEDASKALGAGWATYQRARREDGAFGWERRLLRFLCVAAAEEQPDWVRVAATEIESRYGRATSRLGRAAALLARGVLHRDLESVELGVKLVRECGFRHDQALACGLAAAVADDPEPWLREAYDIAKELGTFWLRGSIRKLMDRRGISLSETRSSRMTFSDTELRIIELISAGRTNRQIAQRMRVSVKTVENNLTRLFAKTGCRSRLDLAAASLKGNLAAVGS